MQTPQMKNPADISNIAYSHPQGVQYDNNINKCEWCRSTLLSTCSAECKPLCMHLSYAGNCVCFTVFLWGQNWYLFLLAALAAASGGSGQDSLP